jgi:NADH-quinone oxidoreductase subunit G
LLSDAGVLSALAAELGHTQFPREPSVLDAELAEFADWSGARVEPAPPEPAAPNAGSGLALATWRPLLEQTVLQDGEPYLAATARPPQVWLSSDQAAAIGAVEGQVVTVTSGSGSVAAPLVIADVAPKTVVVTGGGHGSLLSEMNAGSELVHVTVGGQP